MSLTLRLGKKNRDGESMGTPSGLWINTPLGNGDEKAAAREREALKISVEILTKIIGEEFRGVVHVRLWNGDYWPDAAPRSATIVLNRPSALREMLSANSEVALGEAYLNQAFDVEGELEAAFVLGDALGRQTRGWSKTLSLAGLLHRLPDPKNDPGRVRDHAAQLNGRRNSPERDRNAIRFHYDVSNAFYALWLDPRMVYSCAYFATPETDLETAQLRKLDLICRKLDLKPGERLLEIGSGWGGLLLHAATNYGVKADGITLSEKQLEWTQRLIAERGLQDRVTVRLMDYRDLPEKEVYDKAASVGMVEHVGQQNLPGYFQRIVGLLKPGGLFLNHGIGAGSVPYINKGKGFIDHYVFPDSSLVPLGKMLDSAESNGWEIRDVDSLREHYALTLRHWVRRLEEHHAEAVREVDETSFRIWRLYMAGSAHSFQYGFISVYQTLLAKLDARGRSEAPLTREIWYPGTNSPQE